MSSGALSPSSAAHSTLAEAKHHLSEPILITFAKSLQGGALMGIASTVTMSLVGGLEGNEGVSRVVQGLTFPLGLVMIYFIGAELYTGLPMWYTLTSLERMGTPRQHILSVLVCWLSNLLGALFVAGILSTATGTLTSEPFRSAALDEIKTGVMEAGWGQIFLRAVGCGWLVSLAMYLGQQNHDGISKALGLHLPFAIATASKFPHTVEYMYLGSLSLFLNATADPSDGSMSSTVEGFNIWTFLWKCLLPITLGNSVGGAVGMGLWLWAVYVKSERDSEFVEGFGGGGGGSGGANGYNRVGGEGDDD